MVKKEVNELRAKRLARNANPFALVVTSQANQDPYYQTSMSQKSYAPSSKPSIPTRSHTTTRYKGKETAKPITPPSESASEEDNDLEEAQRDKDMQKNLFGNQNTMNVAGARENVGSPVVLQSGIQCFNCKEFGHFAKECRKPKRVKDFAYRKEKMLLCKQAEKDVPLQAEQYDWLADTDEEIDQHELEAYYSYMAKIQEVPTADSRTNLEPLEQNDQNDVKCHDECVALANLKLDVDENKNIQKRLKKANTTLAQELKECKTIISKTSKTLGESNSVRDSCLVALQNKQTEFEKYKAFRDRTIDYDKLKRKLNETLGQLAQKDIEIKEGLKLKAYEISVKTKVITDLKLKEEHDIDKMLSVEKQLKFLNEIVYKRNQSIQTIHMMAPKTEFEKYKAFNDRTINYDKLERKLNETLGQLAQKDIETCLMPLALKTHNDSFIFVHELKQEMHADLKKYVETKFDKPSVIRQLNAQRIPKPSVLGKPAPFSDSLERRYFSKTKSVPKTNVSEGLSKPVTTQTLPQTARQAGNNLLTGNRESDLYTISLQESTSSTSLCLMAKASPTQAWLWHQRLSYLNFNHINLLSKKDVVIGLPKLKFVKDQLCSSCEVCKAKRSSFKSKAVPSLKGRLNLLHMDLCGQCGLLA
nr:retrovirus-related Pol polyprotein from transposon TNT 1-94 [Tanacetum cinerariifolium]